MMNFGLKVPLDSLDSCESGINSVEGNKMLDMNGAHQESENNLLQDEKLHLENDLSVRIFRLGASKDTAQIEKKIFRDRAETFVQDMGWSLDLDTDGYETDVYDSLSPIIVAIVDGNEKHIASARLLPVSGKTTISDNFFHLLPGKIDTPINTWEVSRLFVNDNSHKKAAAYLMWSGCAFGYISGIQRFIGVTSRREILAYRSMGWKPNLQIPDSSGVTGFFGCSWEVDSVAMERLSNNCSEFAKKNLSIIANYARIL